MTGWAGKQGNIGRHVHFASQIVSDEDPEADNGLATDAEVAAAVSSGGGDWVKVSIGHDLTEIATVGATTWYGLVVSDVAVGDVFTEYLWHVDESYSKAGTPSGTLGLAIGTQDPDNEANRMGATGQVSLPSQTSDFPGDGPGIETLLRDVFGSATYPAVRVTDATFKVFIFVDFTDPAPFDAGAATVWLKKL